MTSSSGGISGSREPDPAVPALSGFDPGRILVERLAKARSLIESGWTQRTDARDDTGEECDPYGDAASCFCANGAICRAFASGSFAERRLAQDAETLLNAAINIEPASPVDWPFIDWNDAPDRTQADVLAAFDRAIELAKAQS